MDEDLFVKLLDLRKYLDGQSDKFIAGGFDINSELISKFFESMEGIEKHIDKIMNLKPFWNNYTTLSWALEALDADREFSWSIDDKEYAGKDYHDLWYTLDCEAKGILPDKLQVKNENIIS